MGEEAVAFAIIIAPLMVRLGYDSITTVLVTYIATQIGFASSWMNPFCVVVTSGMPGVPVLSGSGLRIVVWVIATLIGLIFTMVYASRVKKNPLLSRVRELPTASFVKSRRMLNNVRLPLVTGWY